MKTNTLKILLLTAALLIAVFLANAQDKKISQLPALSTVHGNEQIPIAYSGGNYYMTPSQLQTWLNILSTTLSNGKIYIGNASNVATATVISGDATLANTGALTVNWANGEGVYDTRYLQSITGITAGGDLSGTYPNPTVSKILNKSVATPSVGYFYYNGTSFTYTSAASPLIFNLPLSVSSNTVSIANANTTTTGAITSTDWNTFNGKQNALSGTGFPYSTSGTISYTTSIPNSSLSNSTISGAALGTNLANLINGYGILGGTYNGSGAITLRIDSTHLVDKLFLVAQLAGKQASLSGSGYVFQNGSTTSYTSSIPNSSLANSTISGAALGTNLSNLIAGYGLSGSNYNGSGAVTHSVDTTSSNGIVSKLRLTAMLLSYGQALNGTGIVFQSGTSTTYSTLVTGTYGGTGVNNGSKTITLGGSFITTGTSTPTWAFGTTNRTYTFPDVATTIVGRTGNMAANRIAIMNDANQISTLSGIQAKNFDVVNKGWAYYGGDSATSNFILGNYNLATNTTVLNCPTANGAINLRFQNGANIFSIVNQSSQPNYYGFMSGNFMVGNSTTPSAKLAVSGNINNSLSLAGAQMDLMGATYNSPGTSGTFSVGVVNSIECGTLTATSATATVTYSTSPTLYIHGAPAATGSVVVTNPWTLWLGNENNGNLRVDGKVAVGTTVVPTYQMDLNGDIGFPTVGTGLRIKQGTNGLAGTVALSAGTVTVGISGLATTDIAQGNYTAVSGSSGSLQYACTSGVLTITSITSGGTSTNASDNSTVSYFIIRKY